MSDKGAVLCVFCGKNVRYLANDEKSHRFALEEMRLHEKICDESPLVQKLTAIEKKVDEIINAIEYDTDNEIDGLWLLEQLKQIKEL